MDGFELCAIVCFGYLLNFERFRGCLKGIDVRRCGENDFTTAIGANATKSGMLSSIFMFVKI